jgi:cytidyltransferase-like protein
MYGVFLARMQPVHNAHLWMVEKALSENDRVAIILGSANKRDMIRNPFNIGLRTTMLEEALSEPERVCVYEIPDWTQEGDVFSAKEWGSYFYYNVVSRIKSKKFRIYYSDNPIIMLQWFEDKLKDRIDFRFFERHELFDGLSATKIRHAFESGDVDYVAQFCPNSVVSRFDYLRDLWMKVIQDPQMDFSMT